MATQVQYSQQPNNLGPVNNTSYSQHMRHPTDQQPMGQQPMGQQTMGQQTMGQQPMGQQTMGQQTMGQQPMGQQPMGQQPMGDMIDQLPIDQSVPSHNEIRIVDSLFQTKKGIVDKILVNIKEIIIIGILFIVFSLPSVDKIIYKMIPPTTTSPYILLGVKTVLMMVCYFIISNFYLSRK
jgi:hypothetical protein